MALIPLALHLAEGDLPSFKHLFTSQGLVLMSADLGGGLDVMCTPRQLRLYTDALIEIADEGCRREDALTDVPLPWRVPT